MLERLKKDRVLQILLGIAGLLFLLVLIKGRGKEGINTPSPPIAPPTVQQPPSTIQPPSSPSSSAQLPSSQPSESLPPTQPLIQNSSQPTTTQETMSTAEEEKPSLDLKENDKPKENKENKGAKENKEEKPVKKELSHEPKRQVVKHIKHKQEKKLVQNKPQPSTESFLKGYGLVCVIGGSCALVDPDTGKNYREGDQLKGWYIKSISPKSVILEKDGNIKREELE